MKNLDFCLILTATINPGDMPDLIRKDIETRLNDYKKSFRFWLSKKTVKKIIFIENSNYDLTFFHELSKKNPEKEVEIISTNSNSTFDKNLGKGYGQYLSLKEIFEKSYLAKKTDYFIDVTGRHCVINFDKILSNIVEDESDIYINLTNNLKFADANLYGGIKSFFEKYIIPETAKTDDRNGSIFEECVAKATLKAIANEYKLSKTPIYANIDGYIGTNGKKYNQNIFKKIKLFFFRKIKIYFLNHKKY
tara:strand:- start:269 stop:1015 length:747 start_codon:yes stop_codon:yes gene_type:complete